MKKNNSICHVYYSQGFYGGIERYIKNLCEVTKYKTLSLNLFIHSFFPISNFKLFNKYNLNNTKNLVFHFHGFNPVIILTMFFLKKKIIWTPSYHSPLSTKRPVLAFLNILLLIILCLKKIHIVAHQKKEIKIIKLFLLRGIFYLNPTGHKKINKINKKLKINKYYDAIYIARNDKHKNINLFLELAKRNPKRNFCLITDDIKNLNKTKNIKTYENIRYNQLLSLITNSKFFINVSNYESYGIAAAECEMIGVPSIFNRNCPYNNFEPLISKLKYELNDIKSLNKIFNEALSINKDELEKIIRKLKKKSLEFSLNNRIKIYENIYKLI